MDAAAEPRLLGDYLLTERLAEEALTCKWKAEQVSVGRMVLVDELRPDREDGRAEFIANVRAKAAMNHPLVASVYEAVDQPDSCFCAIELLPPVTLATRLQAGEPFKPGVLTSYLQRIAEANLQMEARGLAAAALQPEAVHLDEHGVIRLENLALGGQRDPSLSARDIHSLGRFLPALVADGQPATTRLLTLLAWMRGEGIAQPLTWAEVRDYCSQISQQLASPPAASSGPAPANGGKAAIWAGIAAALVIGTIGVVAMMRSGSAPVPPPPPFTLPPPVTIPAGEHPTPDGATASHPSFQISIHEVTIGEYSRFLETLKVLEASDQERTYDHADQPPEKISHHPENWDSLLAAARSAGNWREMSVTMNSPVVGVDWWDAAAYAEWKRARLPTQEEWFAALLHGGTKPDELAPGNWQPLSAPTSDITSAGLIGMAGSVAEWTRLPAPNPANPLGQRLWVIAGASHARPQNGALAREWVEDRSLRREDLGFRLVFAAE